MESNRLGLSEDVFARCVRGDVSLLGHQHIIGYLSSHCYRRDLVWKATESWVDTLSPDLDAVVCGTDMAVERDLANLLLRRSIPLIRVLLGPADPDFMSPYKSPVLQISVRPILERRFGTTDLGAHQKELYEQRNDMIVKVACRLVVGALKPGGNVSRTIGGNGLEYSTLTQWRAEWGGR